jgi:hypothetical protein
MLVRIVAVSQAVLFAAAVSGWAADEAKTYSGTFKDSQGREGPLSCSMTAKEAGKFAVNFKAKNNGKGPNREMECSGEFTGKAEGAKVDLSGEITLQRQGAIAVAAVLEDKTLKATFKSKDGKNDGSFDLTLGAPVAKTEAPTPQPAAKTDAGKPKDK